MVAQGDDGGIRGPATHRVSLLESVARHKVLVALIAVATGLAAFGLSYLEPTTYRTEGQVFLATGNEPNPQIRPPSNFDRYAQNEAQRMESRVVSQRVADDLDRLGVGEVDDRVSASAELDADIITVSIRDDSAELAVELYDAVVRAYGEAKRDEVRVPLLEAAEEAEERAETAAADLVEVQALLAPDPTNLIFAYNANLLQATVQDGRADAQRLRREADQSGTGIKVAEPAPLPGRPDTPRPRRNAAAGLAVGLFLGIGTAWWRGVKHPLAGRHEDMALHLGAPMLGAVPGVGAPFALRRDGGDPGATYAGVLALADLGLEGLSPKVLAVTGTDADAVAAGTARLATEAAAVGSVLVVDADQGRRALAGDEDRGPGLHDLLARPDLVSTIRERRLGDRPVGLLPVGSPLRAPSTLYRSPAFLTALRSLASSVDLLVLHVPPAADDPQVAPLLQAASGVVVVVTPTTTPLELEQLRVRLDFVGAVVLGYVVDHAPSGRGAFGGGGARALAAPADGAAARGELVAAPRSRSARGGGAKANGRGGPAPKRAGARTGAGKRR